MIKLGIIKIGYSKKIIKYQETTCKEPKTHFEKI